MFTCWHVLFCLPSCSVSFVAVYHCVNVCLLACITQDVGLWALSLRGFYVTDFYATEPSLWGWLYSADQLLLLQSEREKKAARQPIPVSSAPWV